MTLNLEALNPDDGVWRPFAVRQITVDDGVVHVWGKTRGGAVGVRLLDQLRRVEVLHYPVTLDELRKVPE